MQRFWRGYRAVPVRRWPDEGWDAALSRLAGAGRDAHAAVENATDRAASRPAARLGAETTAELVNMLTPLAQACASVVPYPSPIGTLVPGAAGYNSLCLS